MTRDLPNASPEDQGRAQDIGPNRRDIFGWALAAAALGMIPRQGMADDPSVLEASGIRFGTATPFTETTVTDMARDLATRPFEALPEISAEWKGLTYDQIREIWFDGKHALFRDPDALRQPSAVQAEFFVAGLYQHQKIAINAVEGSEARPITFDLDLFVTTDRFPQLPAEGTGFSGLRLTGEIETPGVFQEYAVFQGASYFRAVGKGQQYGLSARGLALNTISPDAPEEFPIFRAFWIEAAKPDAPVVIVHALLDSVSVTGAYRFAIAKGEDTVMEVSSTLFPRQNLNHVGIAAGTSMFLFNDLNRLGFDDFREGVHDSDGLQIATAAGEILWRPLRNPKGLEASWFIDTNPRGFGLIQRARDAASYNDFAAHYERRPSLWVEPKGNWGAGSVILAEIPADKEIYDNIVAYWKPDATLEAGQEYHFDYRLHWSAGAPPVDGRLARVVATRSGQRVFEDGRLFAIDYEAHSALGPDLSALSARVTATTGEVRDVQIMRNEVTGGVRVDATLLLPADQSSELRVELLRGGSVDPEARPGAGASGGAIVGEIWLYRWVP